MKHNIFNLLIGMALLSLASCSDVLDEQPRSKLTPSMFQTTKGINSGLTAAYEGLRFIGGAQASQFATEYGTDEFTTGEGNPSATLDMSNGATPIDPSTGDISTYWSNLFRYINTCNGIIQYGSQAGVDAGLIAEAHYLRAYYYFQQVQMFGGVPLDLGSGVLKFNSSTTNKSFRNTEQEVYDAIIEDLKFAVDNLPISNAQQGRVIRATAIHLLAKVYLTNKQYQLALDEAEKILDPTNPYVKHATYGVALLSDFAEVHRPGNEHSLEVLMTAEHTNSSYDFNETAAGFASPPEANVGKDDRSLSYYTPNYQTRFKLRDSENGFLQRTIEFQRPWMRFVSTFGLRQIIFADKTNDSRFHSSFKTVYLNNNSNAQNGLLNLPIKTGDTAFVFVDDEVSAGYKATKNYRIYNPSEISRFIFPGMKKFYDPNRKDANDPSGRPFILARLADTYLVAAEAIIMGATSSKGFSARDYVLVLRKRAAKQAHEQQMIDATPATIDIDYILDERSRELCGEQHRWFDLKRTGKWRDRATSFSYNGVDILTREIKAHYDLRPIPKSQLELMGNTPEERAKYQNPVY